MKRSKLKKITLYLGVLVAVVGWVLYQYCHPGKVILVAVILLLWGNYVIDRDNQ